MNCLEAQRLMRSYTEGTLPDKVTEEFLDHIQKCRDCHEELELYLMVHHALDEEPLPAGSKQLDIDEQIRMTRNAISRRRFRKVTLGFLAMVAAVLLALFLHLGLDSHYGVLRRRKKPQKVTEAVMGTVTEAPGETETVSETVTEATGRTETVSETVTEAPKETETSVGNGSGPADGGST
ncbi:MAG: zf-HC2 domain-containing protein [Lachnospiraceae bacterium]|nr:zf-HC2 domain-containing protein [Lachnospiraceae bacterium]